MRKAFEKIVDLYKTPLGQDLLETMMGTGVALATKHYLLI